MEKILNQEEIDALFRATMQGQVRSAKDGTTDKNVSNLNLREVRQINKDRVRALSTLHESIARNIANSLGAYLRAARSGRFMWIRMETRQGSKDILFQALGEIHQQFKSGTLSSAMRAILEFH